MQVINLSFSEVYEFKKFTGLLYSTVPLLMELNQVWDELEFTKEESDIIQLDENGKLIDIPGKTKVCHVNPEGALVNALKYFIESVESDEGISGYAKATFKSFLSKIV